MSYETLHMQPTISLLNDVLHVCTCVFPVFDTYTNRHKLKKGVYACVSSPGLCFAVVHNQFISYTIAL